MSTSFPSFSSYKPAPKAPKAIGTGTGTGTVAVAEAVVEGGDAVREREREERRRERRESRKRRRTDQTAGVGGSSGGSGSGSGSGRALTTTTTTTSSSTAAAAKEEDSLFIIDTVGSTTTTTTTTTLPRGTTTTTGRRERDSGRGERIKYSLFSNPTTTTTTTTTTTGKKRARFNEEGGDLILLEGEGEDDERKDFHLHQPITASSTTTTTSTSNKLYRHQLQDRDHDEDDGGDGGDGGAKVLKNTLTLLDDTSFKERERVLEKRVSSLPVPSPRSGSSTEEDEDDDEEEEERNFVEGWRSFLLWQDMRPFRPSSSSADDMEEEERLGKDEGEVTTTTTTTTTKKKRKKKKLKSSSLLIQEHELSLQKERHTLQIRRRQLHIIEKALSLLPPPRPYHKKTSVKAELELLKLRILTSLLCDFPEVDFDLDNEGGREGWTPSKLEEQFNHYLSNKETRVSLLCEGYILFLDWKLSKPLEGGRMTVHRVMNVLEEGMDLILSTTSKAQEKEESLLALVRRVSLFKAGGGYTEFTHGLLQALVELTFFPPSSQGWYETVGLFEEWWEGEGEARFGEVGGRGWGRGGEVGGEDKSLEFPLEEKGEDVYPETEEGKDPYTFWYKEERNSERRKWLPLLLFHDQDSYDVDDLNRTLLFEDISPFLFPVQTKMGREEGIRLFFGEEGGGCGLPSWLADSLFEGGKWRGKGSSTYQDGTYIHGDFLIEGILEGEGGFPLCSTPLLSTVDLFTYSSFDESSSGTWGYPGFGEREVQGLEGERKGLLSFLLRSLFLLAHLYPSLSLVKLYLLSHLPSSSLPQKKEKFLLKECKSLLKERPTSLDLWEVYLVLLDRFKTGEEVTQNARTIISQVKSFPLEEKAHCSSMYLWVCLFYIREGRKGDALTLIKAFPGNEDEGLWLDILKKEVGLLVPEKGDEGQAGFKRSWKALLDKIALLSLKVYLDCSEGEELVPFLTVYKQVEDNLAPTSPYISLFTEHLHTIKLRTLLTLKSSTFSSPKVRKIVESSLSLFPGNTFFLEVYYSQWGKGDMWGVRRFLSSLLERNPNYDILRIFQIWVEGHHNSKDPSRKSLQTLEKEGGLMKVTNIQRSLILNSLSFQPYSLSLMERGRRRTLPTVFYHLALSSTTTQEFSKGGGGRGKEVYLKAIQAHPFDKGIYLEAFRREGILSKGKRDEDADEREEVVKIMEEREVRLRNNQILL